MSERNQPIYRRRVYRRRAYRRRRVRIALVVAVVVSFVLAGYAGSVAGYLPPWTGSSSDSSGSSSAASDHGATDAATDSAESVTPTPDPTPTSDSRPVLEALDGVDVDRPSSDGLATALRGVLADDSLGDHVGAAVRELDTTEMVYGQGAGEGYVPASTMKILTGVTALESLGPAHRFETTVRYEPPVRPDAPATLTLVGGGDPLLSSAQARDGDAALRPATIQDLAAQTAEELDDQSPEPVRLVFDDTLFTEAESPDWEGQYVSSGVVAPVSSLWVDQAKTDWPAGSPRAPEPGLDAAERFAAELGRHDVAIAQDPIAGTASPEAEQLASVASAPVADLVEHTVLTSDNDAAEVLGQHVALARGEPASFAGVGAAMTDALDELGVDMAGTRIDDASGLARSSRLTPQVLTAVLAVAAESDRPELRPALTGLPIAGYNGTLGERFRYNATDGSGYVRAKTGTLTGVASLAGLVTTADGEVLVFALLTDQVEATDPRPTLDQAAAVLAECGCR